MNFVHIVAKYILYVNMKLLAEMPKIAKCLKCLKLRYSVDFNKPVRNKLRRIKKLISPI